MSSPIVVATSIPPRLKRTDNLADIGDAYQLRCITSWCDAGFTVISINPAEEIPELRKRYPRVDFVPAFRDASAISGRPHPFVVDLLAALGAQSEPIVGIVNSDLYLPHADGWTDRIRDGVANSMLTWQRSDVASLSDTRPQTYQYGFDVFFFERRAIQPNLDRMLFAMGLPWWDYWLPLSFGFRGYNIKVLTQPQALHLAHPIAWQPELWDFMAIEFIEYTTTIGAPDAGADSQFGQIGAYCHWFAATHGSLWQALKAALLFQRQHRNGLDKAFQESWREEFYLTANPDAADGLRNGQHLSGFDHFQAIGRVEGRPYQAAAPDIWDEAEYLNVYPDVAMGVAHGAFVSGWDHYVRCGRGEGRRSVNVAAQQLEGLRDLSDMCRMAILGSRG